MVEKAAKVIGIITIPPLFLLFMVSWIWVYGGVEGFSRYWYFTTLGLLAIVPMLAYPLSYILPKIKAKGREGQRNLAFMLSLTGYIIGVVVGQVGHPPMLIRYLFWGYLLSGSTLAVINRILHYKASGHACGLSGPITFLMVISGGRLWYFFLLMPIVFWARIKQDRHTMGNMLAGTLAGILPTAMVFYLYISNYG
jgi:hypothetical protein